MKELRPAILMLVMFAVICGGVYPVLVTGIAQTLFPKQARGSLVTDQANRAIGSSLIGQPFSESRYFWGRPSASGSFGYNPMASGGSNLGPSNPDYLKTVKERVAAWRETGVTGSIPAELVQASASGLDPDLTPASVALQIPRVAKARALNEVRLRAFVADQTKGRQLGFLGEPRINVLELNLALDAK
jgi:potassium-transporting ATPase KdpC subunit